MPEKNVGKFANPAEDPERAEDAIRGLSGVESCRIVATATGEILEIHVVSSPQRHPKQLIRDIETVLFASMGIRIDRRKVSIARRETVAPPPSPPEAAARVPVGRLRFLALATNLGPDSGEVEVTLGRGPFRGFGKASFTLASDPTRATVDATLQAVSRFIQEGSFQAAAVRKGTLGDREGVFVHVEYIGGGRTVSLVGSALVARDGNLTALFAALDAVNRFAGRLEPARGIEVVAGP